MKSIRGFKIEFFICCLLEKLKVRDQIFPSMTWPSPWIFWNFALIAYIIEVIRCRKASKWNFLIWCLFVRLNSEKLIFLQHHLNKHIHLIENLHISLIIRSYKNSKRSFSIPSLFEWLHEQNVAFFTSIKSLCLMIHY